MIGLNGKSLLLNGMPRHPVGRYVPLHEAASLEPAERNAARAGEISEAPKSYHEISTVGSVAHAIIRAAKQVFGGIPLVGPAYPENTIYTHHPLKSGCCLTRG